MSEQDPSFVQLEIAAKEAVTRVLTRGEVPTMEAIARTVPDGEKMTLEFFNKVKSSAEGDLFPTVSRSASATNPRLYQVAKEQSIANGLQGRVNWVD